MSSLFFRRTPWRTNINPSSRPLPPLPLPPPLFYIFFHLPQSSSVSAIFLHLPPSELSSSTFHPPPLFPQSLFVSGNRTWVACVTGGQGTLPAELSRQFRNLDKIINISLQLRSLYVKDSSCSELDDTGSLTDDCEGGNEEGAGGGGGRRQRRRTDFPSEDEEGDEDEEEVRIFFRENAIVELWAVSRTSRIFYILIWRKMAKLFWGMQK